MVKCRHCMCYNDGHCIESRRITSKHFTHPTEDIECPTYIGVGFVYIERRPERILGEINTSKVEMEVK